MTDTPQILLQHHLKKLRLPTFQNEYAKLAQQCAAAHGVVIVDQAGWHMSE